MRYSRLCAMLQRQGMNVICCTISMFDSVRDWNRENNGESIPEELVEQIWKGCYM